MAKKAKKGITKTEDGEYIDEGAEYERREKEKSSAIQKFSSVITEAFGEDAVEDSCIQITHIGPARRKDGSPYKGTHQRYVGTLSLQEFRETGDIEGFLREKGGTGGEYRLWPCGPDGKKIPRRFTRIDVEPTDEERELMDMEDEVKKVKKEEKLLKAKLQLKKTKDSYEEREEEEYGGRGGHYPPGYEEGMFDRHREMEKLETKIEKIQETGQNTVVAMLNAQLQQDRDQRKDEREREEKREAKEREREEKREAKRKEYEDKKEAERREERRLEDEERKAEREAAKERLGIEKANAESERKARELDAKDARRDREKMFTSFLESQTKMLDSSIKKDQKAIEQLNEMASSHTRQINEMVKTQVSLGNRFVEGMIGMVEFFKGKMGIDTEESEGRNVLGQIVGLTGEVIKAKMSQEEQPAAIAGPSGKPAGSPKKKPEPAGGGNMVLEWLRTNPQVIGQFAVAIRDGMPAAPFAGMIQEQGGITVVALVMGTEWRSLRDPLIAQRLKDGRPFLDSEIQEIIQSDEAEKWWNDLRNTLKEAFGDDELTDAADSPVEEQEDAVPEAQETTGAATEHQPPTTDN